MVVRFLHTSCGLNDAGFSENADLIFFLLQTFIVPLKLHKRIELKEQFPSL